MTHAEKPAAGSFPPFDLQPTLEGKLILLLPLLSTDFEALFAAASDPLIWEQHPDSNRYRLDIFREYFAGAIESHGAFAIIHKATGEIIGSSRYCNLQLDEREVEIGWTFLARAYWGGTYNRELKTLMLDHAFAQHDRHGVKSIFRVVFVVGEKNLRSQIALKKLGATYLTRVKRPTAVQADRHDVIFSITR